MKRFYLAIISILLVCIMALNLTGCTDKTDLMEGITPNGVKGIEDLDPQNVKVTDFAIRLFKANHQKGTNTLVSPLSVLCALSMTVNGAEGETKKQMEAVLGMSGEELNLYIKSYVDSLPQGEKYKLSIANSVWFTDDQAFSVKESFLQTNADYYGADIYKIPFNDQGCKDINKWVKEKTDGMIPEIIKKLSESEVMCLINALAFDAEWVYMYSKETVEKGKFTREDGTKQDAEFMYGDDGTYIEDDSVKGFKKYYKGGKYAFVALLPNEEISIDDYVSSLNGDALSLLLESQYQGKYILKTAIPKFECEFNTEMSSALSEMGMSNAFDVSTAEFGGIGTYADGNIYIGRVIHKTYISVGEQGTKAGAATAVMMDGGSAPGKTPEPEIKTVYLDRPFVYMLVDCENNIPFFMGTVMNVS